MVTRENLLSVLLFVVMWTHKISKNTNVFLRARADHLSIHPQRPCDRKPIGSHHNKDCKATSFYIVFHQNVFNNLKFIAASLALSR